MSRWELIGLLALWHGAAVANTNVGTPPAVFSNVIFQGYATVDGVLSTGEWEKANWIPLDQDYYSSPPGVLSGLDATMNSRASPINFGMLCENSLGGKFSDAGQLRDYRLVGPGKPKIGMVVEFR